MINIVILQSNGLVVSASHLCTNANDAEVSVHTNTKHFV